nr:MAG TPA: hypothetical protein [Caudoviricetes sp.]
MNTRNCCTTSCQPGPRGAIAIHCFRGWLRH